MQFILWLSSYSYWPTRLQSSLQSRKSPVLTPPFRVCSSTVAGKGSEPKLKDESLGRWQDLERDSTHQVDHHRVLKLLVHVLQLASRWHHHVLEDGLRVVLHQAAPAAKPHQRRASHYSLSLPVKGRAGGAMCGFALVKRHAYTVCRTPWLLRDLM